MSIAVDQTRLREITRAILGTAVLDREAALGLIQMTQLAAGVADDEDLTEHATLQAIVQHIGTLVGWRPGEVCAIHRGSVALGDDWLEAIAEQLGDRRIRELAYAYAFLVSVSDLELTAAERTELERFQRVLGLDHRCATDLVVRVSETVAASP